MQLSRALFLSSERTRYHGACFVSVAASMASRAREYSYQRRTDSKSIWLSLLSVVIGSSRNPTSSYQMLGLFFFTIPNPNWDKRDTRRVKQKRPVRVADWPSSKLQSELVRADSGLDFRFVDIEVRVNMLHVVVFFERFHQANHLRGLRARQLDVVLRDHRDFRRCWSNSRLRQRFLHLLECVGRRRDVPRGAIVFQIFGARFQHEVQQLVFARGFLGNGNFALAVEHPPDGAGFGHVAAVLAHEMAELTDHAVAVGGDDLNQHAHSARAISFEGSFFILLAFQLAGAAKNGALDVFTWHVRSLCRQNRSSQARVGVRFASADARGNADFSDDSREYAAALRVGGPFLMFNRGPF